MVEVGEDELAGEVGEEGQGFGDEGVDGDRTAAYFGRAVERGVGQDGVDGGEDVSGFGPEVPFVDVGQVEEGMGWALNAEGEGAGFEFVTVGDGDGG